MRSFSILILLLSFHQISASHIRAGEITTSSRNCQSRTIEVTLTMFGDPVTVPPGSGRLDFGDGMSMEVPVGRFIQEPSLGINVGTFIFKTVHTFGSNGNFKITYIEPNRNAGVLNINNSVGVPFVITSEINITAGRCNESPQMLAPPVDRTCTGTTFFHSPAAYDADGDSLVFKLATPLGLGPNQYSSPVDQRFYGASFPRGNEQGNGPPELTINEKTGLISWNAPGADGEYNIAFEVEEWRRTNSGAVLMGKVRRDMQIIVTASCNNRAPQLSVPDTLCVVAGSVLNQNVYGFDPDNNDVSIEAFSELLTNPASGATLTPASGENQSSVPRAIATLTWKTDCKNIRKGFYRVVFKISDVPAENATRLARFKELLIRIVAPPPIWNNPEIDLVSRKALLRWKPLTCQQATSISIMRRVGRHYFLADTCATERLNGFEEIAVIKWDSNNPTTQFVDDNRGQGLAVGASYCYRLMSLFGDGTRSMISIDTCFTPILANAPVITKASVIETDKAGGRVDIGWYTPYDLPSLDDVANPYRYLVLRSSGRNAPFVLASNTSVTDTTFADTDLNTQDSIYRYKIVLQLRVGGQNISLDTSASASTVRLNVTPLQEKIMLEWSADTPWSNFDIENPLHLVYRREEGKSEFELIDQVNVFLHGFTYTDAGKEFNQGLSPERFYSYKVVTQGTYGNNRIKSPLPNTSQVVDGFIADQTPPCQPKILLSKISCEEFLQTTPCEQSSFDNFFSWEVTSGNDCSSDSYSYLVFASESLQGEFNQIATTREQNFQDQKLKTPARCYRVAAVDRAGNQSTLSEPVCNDNCFFFQLPNVITMNGDGLNERWGAFREFPTCFRFVKNFSITITNRWGKPIFEGKNLTPDTFAWSPVDDSGNKIENSILYWSAEVFFEQNASGAPNSKRINGWLHVMN